MLLSFFFSHSYHCMGSLWKSFLCKCDCKIFHFTLSKCAKGLAHSRCFKTVISSSLDLTLITMHCLEHACFLFCNTGWKRCAILESGLWGLYSPATKMNNFPSSTSDALACVWIQAWKAETKFLLQNVSTHVLKFKYQGWVWHSAKGDRGSPELLETKASMRPYFLIQLLPNKCLTSLKI